MIERIDKTDIIAVVFGLVLTFIIISVISQFQQLPSPLFGGDYYYQLGEIHRMYETPVWEWAGSSNGIGSRPGYFIVYGAIVTIFGKVLGLAPMNAMLAFNYIIPLASLLAFYFLFKKFFENGWVALLGSLIAVSYTVFPIVKYTEFTKYIVLPLFLYSAYLFFKEQNRKNAIVLGLVYGVMALAHSTAFVFASVIVVATFAYLIYREKSFSLSVEFVLSRKWYLLAFLLGFLIAQIYWFEPLFVYFGKVKLGSQLWSIADFSRPSVQFGFLFDQLKGLFFNTSSVFSFLRSLLALGGLALLLKNRNQLKEQEVFIALLFAITFALTFSYFITMPLLGTNFIPNYLSDMYLQPITILLMLEGLAWTAWYAKKYWWLPLAVLFLAWLWYSYAAYDDWYNGQWFNVGRRPLSPLYTGLQGYLLKNTDVHDLILTNNELGFGINGLTGRGLVLTRRSQNDPFIDFDRYQLDGAIMLYGNNREKKIELLKKYNVKYIYADVNWPGLEWQILNGKVVGYFDPIMLFYSPENEKALQENGIKYVKINGWVDPAIRGPDYRTFDLLIVTYDNYDMSGKGPWKSDIDDLLTPVWDYKEDGQVVAMLYKVNY